MLPYSGRWNRLREKAPLRIAYQAISPFVLTGDLARTWVKLLGVLRAYPSTGRHQWVRDRRWVTRDLLSEAAWQLSRARNLCMQIEGATLGGGVGGRWYTLVDFGRDLGGTPLSDAQRGRVSRHDAAYAVIRAITYAPTYAAFSASDRSGSLETVRERVPINRRIDSKARIRHERTSLTVKRLEEGAICDSISRFNSGNSANG
jgi:hypothetical protein